MSSWTQLEPIFLRDIPQLVRNSSANYFIISLFIPIILNLINGVMTTPKRRSFLALSFFLHIYY